MDYLLLTNDLLKPTGKLYNLTDGANFCRSLPITSWNINLSSLTNGSYMFCDCVLLTKVFTDFSELRDGSYMFKNCTALKKVKNNTER